MPIHQHRSSICSMWTVTSWNAGIVWDHDGTHEIRPEEVNP
jgi:hypothetical protein